MSVVLSTSRNVDVVLDDVSAALMTYPSSPMQATTTTDDDEGTLDPITPTNSSNNLQALSRQQPGFFSSDTEVDDFHDFHDTQNSTPDHAASPKTHFYFPGPLPAEPVAEPVRVLSFAPPHPEAKGKSEILIKEDVRRRRRRDDQDLNSVDGQETPQLERAGGAGGAEQVNDKDPGRDYSRRFYVPDIPISGPSASRPKSPERSPPPPMTSKGLGDIVKRGNLHVQLASGSLSLNNVANNDVGTPVILSKAPPHQFTKRVDSTASMSSEVELAATTGSTSSSRATVEAKFQVKVSNILEGEEVRVSGNDTVLGAWDVTKSVPMTRNAE